VAERGRGLASALTSLATQISLPLESDDLGLVFAAGRLGGISCTLSMGNRPLPRRQVTFMYAVWAIATVVVAGCGLADAVWQLIVACFAFNALETAGFLPGMRELERGARDRGSEAPTAPAAPAVTA
jgi:hypothetical protein